MGKQSNDKLTKFSRSQLFLDREHDNTKKKVPTVTWSDFTQSTTFHGIKYIFSDNHFTMRK